MTSKNKVKNDDYFYVDFAWTWNTTGSTEWLKNIKWYKTGILLLLVDLENLMLLSEQNLNYYSQEF
jgi:hypothetical protein